MDTMEVPQVEAQTVPVMDAVSTGVAQSNASKRKEKRMKWWTENMEKRLGSRGEQETTLQSEAPAAGITQKDETSNSKKYPPPVRYRGTGAGIREGDRKKKDSNFTVFVGQIPFDAKEEDVRKLFEAVGTIKTFRWRTNPVTQKFKGFAFVDFENKASFKRAFQLHHAMVNGRQINVEATITGGRKSKHRADHIKDRTAKLRKEGAETLAAKKLKEDTVLADSSSIELNPTDMDSSAAIANEGRKRVVDDKKNIPNIKRVKIEESEDGSQEKPLQDNVISAFETVTDVVVEEEAVSKKPRNVKTVGKQDPSNFQHPRTNNVVVPLHLHGVKPKENHLASLTAPRLHIKFPE